MAISKEKKQELLAGYQEMLADASLTVLAGYQGLTVAEMSRLRARLRESGAEMHVVKNTLARLALAELGVETPDELWSEANAMGVAGEDVAALAKVLTDFAKEDERLIIKAGFLGRDLVGASEVDRLASLPSREVLLAQVVGAVQAPISGLVGVLSGLMRGFVNVLDARAKQLEEGAA